VNDERMPVIVVGRRITMNATCIWYPDISISRTCLKHIISPHRVFPTTQNKGVLPWCRGWSGLVIETFEYAGRVVCMPRVPGERAGVYNGAGLFSRGWGN
jgi:hypothetical protein